MTRRACLVRNLLVLIAIVSSVAVSLAIGLTAVSVFFLVTGVPVACLVAANLYVAAARRVEFPIPPARSGLFGPAYFIKVLRERSGGQSE